MQASDNDDTENTSSQTRTTQPTQQQPLNLSLREPSLQSIPEHAATAAAVGHATDEPRTAGYQRTSLPGYSDQQSSSGTTTQNPQLVGYLSPPAASATSSGGTQPSSENYAPTADELRSQGYALVPVNLNPREIRAGYYTAEELELIQSLLGDTGSVYTPRIAYESEEAGQTSGGHDAETVETEYPSDMEYPAHLDRWRDEEDDYYTSSSEGMCCVLKLSLGTSLTTFMLCYPGLGVVST